MHYESPLIPRWYFARHSFQYNFFPDAYFPRKFDSNTMYQPRQQLPIQIFCKKNYSKNMSSKIEKYQNKLKPRHFDYKTKLFHGSQISSLFFAKTCLGKNCLANLYLGKNLFWNFSSWNSYLKSTFSCKNLYWKLLPWLVHSIRVKPSKCGNTFKIYKFCC